MTIVVSLKVGDGIVLGADSASSLMSSGGVSNVYFSTEKIVNLFKRKPIGLATYGLGGLGGRSISYCARDLRDRFTYPKDPWTLVDTSYTMKQVAERVREFFYEDLYKKDFQLAGTGAVEDDAEGEQVASSFPPIGFLRCRLLCWCDTARTLVGGGGRSWQLPTADACSR